MHDIRSTAQDPHRSVDDAPFGGGPGMVLAPAPVFGSSSRWTRPGRFTCCRPPGDGSTSRWSRSCAALEGFSLVCGRYEGVDQRVVDHLVDGELSVGDVVLAGGEAAAFVVVEAVVRLLPGVMGNEDSGRRRELRRGAPRVPAVHAPSLLPGLGGARGASVGGPRTDRRWRRAMALKRTLEQRPDLIEARGGLTPRRAGALGFARPRAA